MRFSRSLLQSLVDMLKFTSPITQLIALILALAGIPVNSQLQANTEKPNVLVIYYDDMGYSDMGAYDTSQTSLTPNLDTLASGGLLFTAGHSADAVCTPSRYSLITGRYSWRTSRKSGVNGSYSAPMIEDDRFTFAKMFQALGYHTAMVGKWHVGMNFYDSSGNKTTNASNIDFSQKLSSTPYHIGFDYFFGTSASLDMPPYAWIEDDTVLFKGGLVSGGTVDFSQAQPATNADFLDGNPVGAQTRDGYYDPNFDIRDYLQVQAAKVSDIIKNKAASNEPFFIYVPMPSPHTPWAVQDAFSGIAGYPYGDYVYQTDYYTGIILDALEDPDNDPLTNDSIVDETVVFISSDNGPENVAQSRSLNEGRDSNGPFRGVKRDVWEGGTRVPFVIRWPGVITPNTTTDHACWQGDFFATMAAYLGYDFADDEAPDVESFLPILYGNSMQPDRREGFIQHSSSGQMAIVDKNGEWKLIDGTGSGGYDSTYDSSDNTITNVKGTLYATPRQLFNLKTDPGEDNNLLLAPTAAHTEKEDELYAILNQIRGNTRSGTDGSSNVPPPDNDLDGMPNAFENKYPELDRNDPSDAGADFEPDGLNNLEEAEVGSSPIDSDSDDDQLTDSEEVNTYSSLPTNAHSDSDTLEDGEEVLIWGTSPILADTDADGYNDDEELELAFNPRSSISKPEGPASQISLDPVAIQLVGADGTAADPAVSGGVTSGWSEAGDVFVRSRSGSHEEWKTQLFLRFDLSTIEGNLVEAKLRIHQRHRLNNIYSSDLQIATVTEDWGTSSGSYPIYDVTAVTDASIFGNNGDFGSASDASGFYSGTPGAAGTDQGFDVTTLVEGWLDGSKPNYGIRVAINEASFTGAAFSQFDDISTSNSNEQLQLIITYQQLNSQDTDGDGLIDAYELDKFGDLNSSGADDPDADGITTFVEQALGSDPNSRSSLPVLNLDTAIPASTSIAFHRYSLAGLGYELLLSEDLSEWYPFTTYYEYASTFPDSLYGEDYEHVLLIPHSPLPEALFYTLNLQTR